MERGKGGTERGSGAHWLLKRQRGPSFSCLQSPGVQREVAVQLADSLIVPCPVSKALMPLERVTSLAEEVFPPPHLRLAEALSVRQQLDFSVGLPEWLLMAGATPAQTCQRLLHTLPAPFSHTYPLFSF